eukprot:COSAG06_NODE_618_length_13744_cov_19.800220_3_plen_202_part_00
MVAITWLTADMYQIQVKAQWETLKLDMPDLTMEMAMKQITMTIGGLGDSCAGLFAILASGITAAAYDLGGIDWLVVKICEMEKFFVITCGTMILGLSLKLALDYPAGSYMFAPMGSMGCVATFFGLVKAVPFFDRKFPDLLHMLHQAQLVVCAGLGVMFVVLLQAARDAEGFVERCVNVHVARPCAQFRQPCVDVHLFICD